MTPINAGGEMFDRDNWQPLCQSCHDAKTQAELHAVRDGDRLIVARDDLWRLWLRQPPTQAETRVGRFTVRCADPCVTSRTRG